MHATRRVFSFFVGALVMAGAILVLAKTAGVDTLDTLIAPASSAEVTLEGMRMYAAIAGTEHLMERYVKAGGGRSIIEQHEIAHSIGHVLYEREKTRALSLCGKAFNYGCLHEVLGQALDEYGTATGTIISFIEACTSGTGATYGPCAHGIGHGLTYYSDYEESKLPHDLEMCDELHRGAERLSSTHNCYTGIFMEYNERFMNGSMERSFDPSRPLAPCDILTARLHRALCAFWLVPWMHGVIHQFAYTDDTFKSLGEFCRSIEDADMRRQCSLSIARSIAINARFPAETVERFCDAATIHQDGYLECVMRAAATYKSEKNTRTAHVLCERLGQFEQACNAHRGSIVVAELKD